jgi:hypothetical protein
MAPQKEAFLINLWFESREQGEPSPVAWRGSVVHLFTQERRYFTEIADLVTFLTAYAGRPAAEQSRET